MRCRRIRRELLWLARFGEFGPSSQPHLDHLAGCRACRDEVGFDRAMVEQLRVALSRRVEDADPSSGAWDRILARAQTPEPPPAARLWRWSSGLIARLRWATAMAGTGLALVLALNMEIVPAGLPASADRDAASEATSLREVPRMPVERSSLSQIVRNWGGTAARPSEPDSTLTVAGRVQPATSSKEPEMTESPEEATEMRLVFRSWQTPEPGSTHSRTTIEKEGTVSEVIASEPGEPS